MVSDKDARGQLVVPLTPQPANAHAVSPLIFGMNHDVSGWKGATIRRFGGNSTDTYNWENNFNNAGSDWQHANVGWVARYVAADRKNEPAAAIVHFHEESLRRGVPSVVTLPFVGFVAADENGPVTAAEAAPSPRWKKVVAAKPTPFDDVPDQTDDAVYLDELVHFLVKKFGPGDSPRGIRYYALGNEPGLWHETHSRIQRQKLSAREYTARAIEAARAVKKVDPTAKIVGPDAFNVFELYGLCDAPDMPELRSAGYPTFLDYYLSEFAKASKEYGVDLLDVVSMHQYVDADVVNFGGIQGVTQNARTFWDKSYFEPSWVGEVVKPCLPIFPWMKQTIANRYPGREIGVMEYERKMGNSVYGGIALADFLGVMAQEQVLMATAWPEGGFDGERPAEYAVAALDLWRNVDGSGTQFPLKFIPLTNPNVPALAAYMGQDDATGNQHFILISKLFHDAIRAQIPLGGPGFVSAYTFGFNEHHAELLAMPKQATIEGSTLQVDVPRRSALHVIVSKQPKPPQVEGTPKVKPMTVIENWQGGLSGWGIFMGDDPASPKPGADAIAAEYNENNGLSFTTRQGYQMAVVKDDATLAAKLAGRRVVIEANVSPDESRAYTQLALAWVGEGVPFANVQPIDLKADGEVHRLRFDLTTLQANNPQWFKLWIVTNTPPDSKPARVTIRRIGVE